MQYKYPVAKPELTDHERDFVREAMGQGWISSKGPHVKRFEEAFASFLGVRHAVACSSGTAALILALDAIHIAPGDEVIVPEFTMVASAWAVTLTLGAKPVFVDCGDDLNIDVSKIEAAITPKTKAIMPVHIYGRACDMDEIQRIANKHHLHIIEDCAEAHGARWNGREVGTFGKAAAFSLFANKIITSGEGGIVVTDDDAVAARMRKLVSMFFDEHHSFLHEETGYNFRMTNIQAAVALGQVNRINDILVKRINIRQWYDRHLRQFRTVPHDEGNVLWMYDVVAKNAERRDRTMAVLAKEGIETRFFFKPMSMQPMFAGRFEHLKAYDFSRRGLYLPTYNELTESDVTKIALIAKKYL